MEKKLFQFGFAEEIANDIFRILEGSCEKMEIVGSIRRMKPMVHDIDMVVLNPKKYFYERYISKLPNIETIRKGDKLIAIYYRGIEVDFYLADSKIYGTLKLIRTGSAQHNQKLCMIAQSKGMKLYASGQGLLKGEEIIANTEDGILIALLGKNIPPEERD